MTNWRHGGCKLLASLAWIVAAAWFVVCWALTWGFIPIAMAYWSVLALPVAALTVRWLRGLGQRVPSARERCMMAVWAALLLMLLPLFFAGDHPFWDNPWVERGVTVAFGVYFVFPVAVTAWAFVSIIRARSIMPGAA